MNYDRYNKITFILFIATLVSIVLLASSFWRIFLEAEISAGAWPVVFLILSILGLSGIFFLFRKATDRSRVEQEIEAKITQTRNEVIREFSKENEEESVEEESVDIEDRANRIIPKGNFKTTASLSKKVLENLGTELQAVQAIFYLFDGKKKYNFLSGYALTTEEKPADFELGENLNGQAAKSAEIMIVSDIPENYFEAESGLGKSKPKYLTLLPVVHEKTTLAVIEIATFIEIGDTEQEILRKAATGLAEKLVQLQKS